ncbi:MAG: sugar phosphate isomerase/epimerase family protein [Pirellulaceae bacterium]
MKPTGMLSRRGFVLGAASSMAALSAMPIARADEPKRKAPNKLCAFVKFLQSLSFSELADVIADLGFDGIEATVRPGGQIPPERAEEELPKLVEALRRRGLEVTIMTTAINDAHDKLSRTVLKTAADLGVKKYRMGYYRYDLSKPIAPQLNELRPALRDLAALNRELGVAAVYQNHSGAKNVGAPVWDLHELLRDIPPREIGVAFDIRHATVEGGLDWPIHFQLMRPHLGAVYIKDFHWQGRRPENVPLGEGQVDPAFFKQLAAADFTGPISLHVEYLPKAGTDENIAALRRDLATLRKLLPA